MDASRSPGRPRMNSITDRFAFPPPQKQSLGAYSAVPEFDAAVLDDDDDVELLSRVSLSSRHTRRGSFLPGHLSQKLSSVWEATFNFTNSIVGAGIIGLPFAFLEAGFVTGLILLVGITLVVDWTVNLLVADAKLASKTTYLGLVSHCFGKWGYTVIGVFQFLFAYGAMCAYAVIVGDTIPVVFSHFVSESSVLYGILTNRRLMIAVFVLGVSLPLSLYRDITALSKTSLVSLVAILLITIAVCVRGPQLPAESKGTSGGMTVINGGLFQAIGVISFAFVCHHNTFLIYGSLHKPTIDRMAVVTHLSTGASLILCLVLALSGYLVFTDKTQANILNNFPQDDTLINFSRALFAVNMFLTLPLECFVCREVIYNYFFDNPFKNGMSSDGADPHLTVPEKTHWAVTIALVGSATLIALTTCDLGFVLEITGGLAATVLAFIMPPACYLKLASGPLLTWKKGPAVACVVFGIFVMVLSTSLTVRSFVSNDGHAKSCNW
ncbi:AAAP amino acid permease [Cladochytrium replicatum]|nr:AAAP amino acid permease [Cladochytrium replicatum]